MKKKEKKYRDRKCEFMEALTDEQQDEFAEIETRCSMRAFTRAYIIAMISFTIIYILVNFVVSPLIQKSSLRGNIDETVLLGSHEQEKMKVLVDTLKQYYYEDVEDADIQEGIYAGILSAANDPYTCYYTREEVKELNESLEGVFYGIGVTMQADSESGYIKVVSILDESPASKCDIKENDIVIKVDGENVYGMELNDVVKKIRGEEGTSVVLTLLRNDREIETQITRGKVETPTVKYEKEEGDIAYIRISEFDDVTAEQFKDAKEEMLHDNAKGLILDLRGNPGGSIDAVVSVANDILPAGLVVYTEDKNGNRKEYTCDGQNEIKIPIIVLVDGNSASAAEILAGAIKDYEKGVLLGTTTFGKGIVQSIMQLKDGSAVKITVSKYYTPKGVNIHKTGIEPDVEVKFDSAAYLEDETDNQLEEALKRMKDTINKEGGL